MTCRGYRVYHSPPTRWCNSTPIFRIICNYPCNWLRIWANVRLLFSRRLMLRMPMPSMPQGPRSALDKHWCSHPTRMRIGRGRGSWSRWICGSVLVLLLKLMLFVTFCTCGDECVWSENTQMTCSELAMHVVFADNIEPSFLTKNQKKSKPKNI